MKTENKKKCVLATTKVILSLWIASIAVSPLSAIVDTSMSAKAETLSISGESIAEQILSVEDATLQNYSVEDLIATQSYILAKQYNGPGRVIDVNDDGVVDVFDLGLMKQNYKEKGNYYELLAKFDQNSKAEYSVSAENGEIISNIVLVQATCAYDFSRYNPISLLGTSDYYYVLQFKTCSDAEKCVNSLNGADNIIYAQMNGSVQIPPDDLQETEIKGMQIESSSLSWGVSVIEADKYASYLSQKYSGQVTVAVIDTGVANHSFLNSRILKGGYDAVNHDYDPRDDQGHGTHVAGTIVDCTSGLNINILPIKVLNAAGKGFDNDIIAGIDWAIDNHVDIINLSLGPHERVSTGGAVEYTVEKAIAAGITVVKSAGNENDDTKYHSPANSKASIVVASIDSDLNRSIFNNGAASNYGQSVDVAAPGSKIKSSTYDGGYGYKSGTSMAAPHIAAAAAMIKYQYPNYTPSQVESALINTCMDLGTPGKDIYYGYGVPKLSKLIKKEITPVIKLSSNSITLSKGEKATLSASVTPGDVDVKWTTSDASVATVSNGIVTANSSGTATITAFFTYNGSNYSATCKVTIPSITLSETSKTVYQTDAFSLTASTFPSGQTINWSTSNSSVAKVSNGKVTAVSPGTATITASFIYEGKTFSTSCVVTVKKVSVEVSKKNLDIIIGDTANLTANTSPPGLSVAWQSSNVVIASVSGGKVTAKAPGKVTLTASITYNGVEYTDTCAVVSSEPYVNLSQSQLKLTLNDTATLVASTYPSNQKVTWSTADSSICSVDSNGKLTAKSVGNTIITATMTYAGKVYSKACNVIVGIPTVKVSPNPMKIFVGGSDYLVASVVAVDGSSVNETTDVIWSSSNEKIATVSQSGKVTGIKAGSAIITAKYYFAGQYYSATSTVTVQERPSITLNKRSLSLYIGDTSTLSATVTPTGQSVSWSSSKTSVATVSSTGKITAVSNGTTTITASFRYDGVTYSETCTVTVIRPSISLSSSSGSVIQGNSVTISATTNPSGYSVSWYTSNSSVASVSGGQITGKSAGTATITAKFTYAGNTYSSTYSITVYGLTLTLSSYSGSGSQDVWDGTYLNDGSACGNLVNLPSATYTSGASISWSIISGNAKIVNSDSQIFFMQPGTVTARCTVYNNGYNITKDYTYSLSLYKTTQGNNNIRSGPGSGYSNIGVVPQGETVTITQLSLNGTAGESGSSYWGKMTYNGITGWIIISQW